MGPARARTLARDGRVTPLLLNSLQVSRLIGYAVRLVALSS